MTVFVRYYVRSWIPALEKFPVWTRVVSLIPGVSWCVMDEKTFLVSTAVFFQQEP